VGNRRLPPCRSACRVDGGLFHHCRGHLRHDNQPYLFFWQASEEVEDEEGDPAAEPLLKAPAQAPRQLRRMRLDTMVGMGVSNLVALFIVLTTAATLHAHGVTNVETSADAAKALKPIAGELAFAVFALGIVGTGLLAVPVLAGSASRAPAFYLAIAGATLVGALLNFSPLDPIKTLIFSAIVNGVAAVPIMVLIMHMASRREVIGEFALKLWLKVLGRSMVWRLEATGEAIASPYTGAARPARSRRAARQAPKRI
jgi:Mn2+/Fe2+ NRAMP family transporter